MKQVRVGIAGLGRVGMIHACHLARQIEGARLVAACSIVPEELEAARRELGVEQTYADFNQMIEQAEIDAVVIVTTTSLHAEQIQFALEAGKHVFTEKPMGVNAVECKQVETCVKAHPELAFMVGFMRRFDPSYLYAKKKIEEGAIGRPYLVKATGLDPKNSIASVLKYARTSSGLFIGMGVHDVDLMHWFLGSRAVSVSAIGGNFAYPEFGEFGDVEVGLALYQFENGAMGMLHTGRTAPHGYHIETEIVGTEGSIRISPVPQKNLAVIYGKDGVTVECVEEFRERFTQAFLLELSEFINCIRTGRKPDMDVSDAVAATTVVEATTRAFKEHSIMRIAY